jgi:hypothetical protein
MQSRIIKHHNTTSERLPLDRQRFNPLLAPDEILTELEQKFAQAIYIFYMNSEETKTLKFTDLLFTFSYINSEDFDTYTNLLAISEISVRVRKQTQNGIEILEMDEAAETIDHFQIAIHPGLNHIKKWDFVYNDDDFDIDRYDEPDEDDEDLYFAEKKLLELDDPYIESQVIDILDTYGDLVSEKMGNVFSLALDENPDGTTKADCSNYLYAPYIAEFYKKI